MGVFNASKTQPRESAKKSGGFFLPDAFTNPEHVHYALKTTAAAMFCYFLYSLLDWPSIHTSLITCYIVSLGTTAETIEKLSLRILGCLVGAAAGIGAIVYVIPSIDLCGGSNDRCIPRWTGVSAWIAVGGPSRCLCRLSDRLRLLSLRHPGLRAIVRYDHSQGSRDRHF